MRAFRFSLEPVLKVRRLQEQQSLAELQNALAVLQVAERELDMRRQQRSQTEDDLRARLQGCPVAAELITLGECLSHQTASIAQQAQVVDQLAREHQLLLEAYLLCRRQREAIEKLRQQARHQHQYDHERELQIEADDMAMLRLARGNG